MPSRRETAWAETHPPATNRSLMEVMVPDVMLSEVK